MTYSEVISLRFGKSEFSVKDLELATNNARSAKLLSELKTRGIVERIGRGEYRLLDASYRPDIRSIEWNRVRNIIKRAPWSYVYADSSAVEIWTDERYIVSPSPFTRVFFLEVRKTDLAKWKSYFYSHGISIIGKKSVGAFVHLIPRIEFEAIEKDGEYVIPKSEVIKMIRKHPGKYAGADKLIGR